MRRRSLFAAFLLAVGLILGLVRQWPASPAGTHEQARERTREHPGATAPASPRASAPAQEPARVPATSLDAAARDHLASGWVEGSGLVAKRLPKDRKGNPHQRFLLRLADGTTVLVAHNTAIAAEVPLAEGDRVEIRGEYKWNARGGILHWTHHDPKGRRQGGWIKLAGQTYD